MIKNLLNIRTISCSGLMLLSAQAPIPQSENVMIYGVGANSCQSWLEDPSAQIQERSWILGYWSALNWTSETTRLVGQQTDGQGIVGEVMLGCRQHPSSPLFVQIRAVYEKLGGQTRFPKINQ